MTFGQSHKLFKNRLNDHSVIEQFATRHILSNEYVVPTYINEIRKPDILLLYTSLRSDLNKLGSSRASKKRKELCTLCHNETGTVSHFIARCPAFVSEKNNLREITMIMFHMFHLLSLSNKCDNQQFKYILDLRRPHEIINQCCKFVADTYVQ